MRTEGLSSSRLGLNTNGAEHEVNLQSTRTSEDAAHGDRDPRGSGHHGWTMDEVSKDSGLTLEGPSVDAHVWDRIPTLVSRPVDFTGGTSPSRGPSR